MAANINPASSARGGDAHGVRHKAISNKNNMRGSLTLGMLTEVKSRAQGLVQKGNFKLEN